MFAPWVHPGSRSLSPSAAPYFPSRPAFSSSGMEATPQPCRYHTEAPNPLCLGCRMAMGGQADSYVAERDFSVRCYYSGREPIVSPEPLVPVSPTPTSDEDACPANPGETDEESYLLRMRYAMQEMDNEVEFVVGERFLDLGCCPGGFSTFVLNKLPHVIGDGVSLPVELGGHSLAIPQALRSRFTVHWGDITQFNHAIEHSGSGKLCGLPMFPIPANTYDLVIADGHSPPIMLRQLAHVQRYARDMLLVSQLLAAVRAVKLGGTILVKLSLSLANQTYDGFMHRIVIALGRLSSQVPLVALKPKSIYATAGTFYILVRGIEAVPRRGLELLLESLWLELLEGRGVDQKALNSLASPQETKNHKAGLAALLAPAENVRRVARASAGR